MFATKTLSLPLLLLPLSPLLVAAAVPSRPNIVVIVAGVLRLMLGGGIL